MRKYIMEAIGSFSYLLFGAIIQLFVMNYLTNINFILEVFYISFGYAFSFFVIYFLLNQYNNYYVNPIFSFSSWLQNKTSNKDFVFISLFQIIGAFLSGLILKLCFLSSSTRMEPGSQKRGVPASDTSAIFCLRSEFRQTYLSVLFR